MPVRRRRAPIVGRTLEMGSVLQRLSAAGAGEGGVVFVGGEPGIGKSRLLGELGRRAQADGFLVFRGRSYEPEGLPPYLPFIEALTELVGTADPEAIRGWAGGGAGDLGLLAPRLGEGLGVPPPAGTASLEHERYRMFESVTEFLFNAARSGPGAVLLLDDLHWADSPSLLLLRHIARRIDAVPLLMAGTYRTVDAGEGPFAATLAELRRERLAEVMTLSPLSRIEATVLVAGMCGIPPAPQVMEAIHRETAGNPFFIEEVLEHLLERGFDIADPRAAVGAWGIPEGVREAIGRRLGRLSEAVTGALQAASVLGDGFGFDVLHGMIDTPETDLLDAIDEALRAGVLLEADGGFQFAHALIRQTIYDGLSLPRCQRLHRRAGLALEAALPVAGREQRIAEVASHFRQAAELEPQKALGYAERAAASAEAVYAWEDAVLHWGAVLAIQDRHAAFLSDEAPLDVLLRLAEAQRRAGALQQAMHSFRRAADDCRAAGDRVRFAIAVLGFERARLQSGEPRLREHDPSILLLEEALAATDDATSELCARILASLARAVYFAEEIPRGRLLSAEALDLARRLDSAPVLADALSARRITIWGPDDVEERRAVVDELVAVAGAAGEDELALEARQFRLYLLDEIGAWSESRRELEVYCARLVELREPAVAFYAPLLRSIAALNAGELAAAEHFAEEALLAAERSPSVNARVLTTVNAWAVLRELGRGAELGAAIEAFGETYRQYWGYSAFYAVSLCEHGRTDDARGEYEYAIDSGLPGGSRDHLWLSDVGMLAEVCWRLRDTRRAPDLYRLLEPYTGRYNNLPGPMDLALARLAAVLQQWQLAEDHFAASLAWCERTGAHGWAAHTLFDHALMLAERGVRDDRGRAIDLARRAQAAFTAIGAPFRAEQARALVQRLVPKSARIRSSSRPNGLSERETEVLRLIALGRTNREIADTLWISHNTVIRHVANIFAKTGAANRAEAATYAARHNLLQ